MKIKGKSEKTKKENVLRGPRVKKMKTPVSKVIGLIKKPAAAKTIEEKLPSAPKVIKTTGKKAKKQNNEEFKLLKLGVSSETVAEGVASLIQLYDEYRKNKPSLLNEKEPIQLQLAWIRIPVVPEARRKYVKLRHSILGSDPEVCLFVMDRRYKNLRKFPKIPDERIEESVEYYQEILKMNNVKGITTIMPYFQLRTEYDRYELKRKLADRFDLFLVQSTLLKYPGFLKNVGSAFTKKNKFPLAIHFPEDLKKPDPAFKDRVEKALHSAWYLLKPGSDTVTLRVANVTLSQQQITENVMSVLHQLTEESADGIPGGHRNLRSIMLKTSKSKAIPIYISLTPKEKVPIPTLKSVRPTFDAVEGDVSTLPGKKVTVTQSGEVFVTDDPDDSYEDSDDDQVQPSTFAEESDDEDSSTEKPREARKPQKRKKTAQDDDDDDDDSDDDKATKAERLYLKAWNKATEEDSEEEPKAEKTSKAESKGMKKKKGAVHKKAQGKKKSEVSKKKTKGVGKEKSKVAKKKTKK